MKNNITVYQKPTCTTCRKLNKLFDERGIDSTKVNYFVEPFTETKLRSLIKKTGLRPFDVLRRAEAGVRKRGITAETTDEVVIAAMLADPSIIQRPIVEVGDRAVLARPIESAIELIDSIK